MSLEIEVCVKFDQDSEFLQASSNQRREFRLIWRQSSPIILSDRKRQWVCYSVQLLFMMSFTWNRHHQDIVEIFRVWLWGLGVSEHVNVGGRLRMAHAGRLRMARGGRLRMAPVVVVCGWPVVVVCGWPWWSSADRPWWSSADGPWWSSADGPWPSARGWPKGSPSRLAVVVRWVRSESIVAGRVSTPPGRLLDPGPAVVSVFCPLVTR